MADPAEIAQRVLDTQAKILNKAMKFVLKIGKQFVKNLTIVTDAFKFLVSKIRMIQGFIPNAIVNNIKAAFSFLKSVLSAFKSIFKEILKFMTSILKVVKEVLSKVVIALWKKIIAALKRVMKFFHILINRLILMLKKIIKMVPFLSQAAAAIRMLVSNIADIIQKLFLASPLLAVAKLIKAKLEAILRNVAALETHIARKVTKVVKNMA